MNAILNVDTELGIFLHVIIASTLAGFIGIERELSNKPAGFRTQLLIGGAAALWIFLGRILVESYQGSENILRIDPLRILEAIIVGVSFIGAGTILKSEHQHVVRFLTTAASTLFSAGIGIAVALQHYFLAIGLTAFALIATYLLGKLDYVIDRFQKDNSTS